MSKDTLQHTDPFEARTPSHREAVEVAHIAGPRLAEVSKAYELVHITRKALEASFGKIVAPMSNYDVVAAATAITQQAVTPIQPNAPVQSSVETDNFLAEAIPHAAFDRNAYNPMDLAENENKAPESLKYDIVAEATAIARDAVTAAQQAPEFNPQPLASPYGQVEAGFANPQLSIGEEVQQYVDTISDNAQIQAPVAQTPVEPGHIDLRNAQQQVDDAYGLAA